MSDDYSAYRIAQDRIAQMHAEARAARLAREVRPRREPTWSARLWRRVSRASDGRPAAGTPVPRPAPTTARLDTPPAACP